MNALSAADLKNPPGSIYQGEPKGEKAACTITLADEDFVALAMGKLDPQQVHRHHSGTVDVANGGIGPTAGTCT